MRQYAKNIRSLIFLKRRNFAFIGALMVINALLDLVGIGFLVPLISLVVTGHLPDYFSKFLELFGMSSPSNFLIACICTFVFVFRLCFSLFNNWCVWACLYENESLLRIKIFNYTLSASTSLDLEQTESEMVNVVSNHTLVFTQNVLFPILRITGDMVAIVVISVFLITINIHLFLVTSVLFCFLVLITDQLARRHIGSWGAELNFLKGEIIDEVSNVYRGRKQIQLYDASSFFLDRIKTLLQRYKNKSVNTEVVSGSNRLIFEFFLFLLFASLVTFKPGENDSQFLGDLFYFGAAALRLAPLFNNVSMFVIKVRYGESATNILAKNFVRWRV